MHFRLDATLPLATHIGDESYVLELVHSDTSDDCWLRARSENEPVVFLVARFDDFGQAHAALRRGIEVSNSPFVLNLLQSVAAEDPKPLRRARTRHQDAEELEPTMAALAF